MRWVLAVLCLSLACGDDDDGARVDTPDASADTGAFDGGRPGMDAGIFDASMPESVGFPPTPSGTGVSPSADRYEDEDDPLNAGACYDTLDNDGDDASEGTDCGDLNCALLSSCCVASTESGCCTQLVPEANVLENLTPCEGLGPAGCVAGATEFGAPRPTVNGGVLFAGNGDWDSGLLLGAVHDLRSQTVTVRADVRQATECGSGCLESVAFGVTTQASIGDTEHVEPIVALVVSGARREARLVVGGSVVRTWAAVGDGPWTLELRPSGDVWVARDAEAAQPVASFTPVNGARIVGWGHNRNPEATDDRAARLRSLTVSSRLCDIPSAWRRRQALRVEDAVTVDTLGASGPTVILDEDAPLLVYEWQGSLFAARAPSAPNRYFTTTDAPAVALLAGDGSSDLREPELVRGGPELWLYYVQETDTMTQLVRASVLDGATRLSEVSVPTTTGGFGSVDIGDPTIVPIAPPDRDERYAMVLRVGGDLVAFASIDGLFWDRVAELPLDQLGADEVREPSLVVVNGGYQLFVSVRRGTRWRQALFASAELVFWRLVDDRALMAGGNELESLGIRDLDVMARGGTLEVVYVGLDGTRETLHRAERPIPTL